MNESKYFGEASDFLQQAIRGNQSPSGKGWVNEFERRFADRLEVEYAIATNSGTSAIHAGLAALGVGPGDEVISPALTVIMDAFATIALGATPIFADVDPDSWIMDPLDVESKISTRTKAIIVVSWFGLPVDMEPYRVLSEKYRLPILDDSAETLFVRDRRGAFAGTSAHVGAFSFEEKKHLTTGGEGGMLVTNSEDLAIRARKFAGLGYKHMTAQSGRTSLDASVFQQPEYQRFDSFGLNYRMTPITAAIGLGQLENLETLLERRKRNASLFLEVIQDWPWMIPQRAPDGSDHGYYTLGIRYEGEQYAGVSWHKFYELFRDAGGDGFYANCQCPFNEPFFAEDPKRRSIANQGLVTCPTAVELQKKVMAFKTHYVSNQEAEQQARALRMVLEKISS